MSKAEPTRGWRQGDGVRKTQGIRKNSDGSFWMLLSPDAPPEGWEAAGHVQTKLGCGWFDWEPPMGENLLIACVIMTVCLGMHWVVVGALPAAIISSKKPPQSNAYQGVFPSCREHAHHTG